MTDLHPHPAAAAQAKGKGTLYLQFRIDQQRFALDVHEVVEVLPRRPLKPIARHRPGSLASTPTVACWCR